MENFRGRIEGGPFELTASDVRRIRDLMGLLAGDPRLAETAQVFLAATAVTDAAVVSIAEAQEETRLWSLLFLQFTQASGRLRFDITGGNPTAAGRGIQIPSGGGEFLLRGTENIRRFRLITETGELANFSGILFQAPAFPNRAGY